MKISQKQVIRKGKRKNTTAKALSMEIVIFPTAMISAISALFHSITQAGVVRMRPPPCVQAVT